MSLPPTPMAREDQPSAAACAPVPSAAGYEIRTLRTQAECEEAAALVQNRQRWLTMRRLPVPARADVPARFRDPQARPVGMYDDGNLLACMFLQLDPDLGWGTGRCLFLHCLHTLPGQNDNITRLITLWASGYAAQLGLPVVRAETLARHALDAEPTATLLRRLTDMGWVTRGCGTGREGERVARLELAAEPRPGLSAFIACRVHDPEAGPGGPAPRTACGAPQPHSQGRTS
ncbi:hypothetical protein [Streptomyces sp. NPDC094031]|uniref:hypothetical protein n=1 Tax=Streptomyces sp. NPDC094031 TaxID=3155307 RepID=UPI00331ACC16